MNVDDDFFVAVFVENLNDFDVGVDLGGGMMASGRHGGGRFLRHDGASGVFGAFAGETMMIRVEEFGENLLLVDDRFVDDVFDDRIVDEWRVDSFVDFISGDAKDHLHIHGSAKTAFAVLHASGKPRRGRNEVIILTGLKLEAERMRGKRRDEDGEDVAPLRSGTPEKPTVGSGSVEIETAGSVLIPRDHVQAVVFRVTAWIGSVPLRAENVDLVTNLMEREWGGKGESLNN